MANHLTYNDKEFSVGDTIRVHVSIKEEGDKTRIQVFEGILIAVDNRESNKMFTVRKIGTDSIGIERIFPVDAPFIANIELKKAGKVRRAKLHYLRGRVGKTATNIKQNLETEAPADK